MEIYVVNEQSLFSNKMQNRNLITLSDILYFYE